MVSIVATIIKKNTPEDIIVVNELIAKFFLPVKFDITLVIVLDLDIILFCYCKYMHKCNIKIPT
tara:strand:- start:68623 stop:68814 length:192 start_codon:yes stop_codon:yes gene_type:complete